MTSATCSCDASVPLWSWVGVLRLSACVRFYLFCRPVYQVVGQTNEMVEAKLQLKVETQRILSQMTLKASETRASANTP